MAMKRPMKRKYLRWSGLMDEAGLICRQQLSLPAYSNRQYMGFSTSWDTKKNHSLEETSCYVTLYHIMLLYFPLCVTLRRVTLHYITIIFYNVTIHQMLNLVRWRCWRTCLATPPQSSPSSPGKMIHSLRRRSWELLLII